MISLTVIRHGQTTWNVEGRMQGQLDSPLTDMGREQAAALSNYLNLDDYDAILTSPIGRAYETARILKGDHSIPIIKENALAEMNIGKWQGMLHTEVKELHGELHHNFWEEPHLYKTDELGGEDFSDIVKRVGGMLEGFCQEQENKRFLLVSHTIAIKAIVTYVEDKPLEKFWKGQYIAPTSTTHIEVENGMCHIHNVGVTEHLEESSTDFWNH